MLAGQWPNVFSFLNCSKPESVRTHFMTEDPEIIQDKPASNVMIRQYSYAPMKHELEITSVSSPSKDIGFGDRCLESFAYGLTALRVPLTIHVQRLETRTYIIAIALMYFHGLPTTAIHPITTLVCQQHNTQHVAPHFARLQSLSPCCCCCCPCRSCGLHNAFHNGLDSE